MEGLFVWANSYCRSTLAFYRGLGNEFHVPLKVIIIKGISDIRKQTGFCDTEFQDMDVSMYQGLRHAELLFQEYKGYLHIFGSYQTRSSILLIKQATQLGIHYGIASEAPCNMTPYPKRILKDFYIHCILPRKVKSITQHANFIINFSGDNSKDLIQLGWDKKKIIPCGYYSPAIIGSSPIQRTKKNWENFSIMLSGIHQWHRSPLVLLKALKVLDKRGVKYECYITQKGPLYDSMKDFIKKNQLEHAHLLGFLPIEKLTKNYESCSVYIGAGNNEPWGMRLNDALLCAAPLIVNKGMGGYKLVKDYLCGLTFERNNHIELADAIQRMATDYDFYQKCADSAFIASQKILPEVKAKEIAQEIVKNIEL